MHFLVTGHTGFKGAWLTMMLHQRGHRVTGLALDPEPSSLFMRANLSGLLEADHRLDIRDAGPVRDVLASSQADVVVHLAAQALVRESYRNPRYTFETNVDGTLNVLDALAHMPGLRAALIVTTDKVYRNNGRTLGYTEQDALAGADPYSASKAMADLLTQSWMRNAEVPIAIARAGNVIGGGDICAERLIPDLVEAFERQTPAQLRNPHAVRPWQHVLDCLDGYLRIVDALVEGHGMGAWNVGPADTDSLTVGQVATAFTGALGAADWQHVPSEGMPESHMLRLDCTRIETELNWRGALTAREAVARTAAWHRSLHDGEQDALQASMQQLAAYDAARRGAQ